MLLAEKESRCSWLNWAALVVVLLSSTHAVSAADDPQTLEDGVYAVIREASTQAAARAGVVSDVVLPHDATKYTGESKSGSLVYLALETSSFVPLILEKPPDAHKDERGWTTLDVTLARQHAKTLENLTRTHLGGKVAVVLDGQIVTTHKVRSVISEGNVKITRCFDDACEVLRRKLTN